MTRGFVGLHRCCADHDAPMSGTWVEVVKQRATLDPGDPLKNWLIYVLEI